MSENDTKRRDFIKSLGLAGIGAALTGPLLALNEKSYFKQIGNEYFRVRKGYIESN